MSKDVDTRIKVHLTEILNNTHSNNHLINAVNKYGWDNLIKEVLFTDNEETCYMKEAEMRPKKSIGWNIAPGGHRGPGRQRGQSISKESIEKAKETIRARNERILSGNTTATDVLFLERKEEKFSIKQQKILEKKQAKIKEKELKKQQKHKEKEAIRLEKSRNRTTGVLLTQQPPRPMCANCGTSPAKPNGKSVQGFQKWHKYCVSCAKAAYNPQFGYLLKKKKKCQACGFVAADTCQLDMIDGKTICANCSRLHRKNARKKSILDITTDSDVGIS